MKNPKRASLVLKAPRRLENRDCKKSKALAKYCLKHHRTDDLDIVAVYPRLTILGLNGIKETCKKLLV